MKDHTDEIEPDQKKDEEIMSVSNFLFLSTLFEQLDIFNTSNKCFIIIRYLQILTYCGVKYHLKINFIKKFYENESLSCVFMNELFP